MNERLTVPEQSINSTGETESTKTLVRAYPSITGTGSCYCYVWESGAFKLDDLNMYEPWARRYLGLLGIDNPDFLYGKVYSINGEQMFVPDGVVIEANGQVALEGEDAEQIVPYKDLYNENVRRLEKWDLDNLPPKIAEA